MSPELNFNVQCQARNKNFYFLDTSILCIYLFILTCASSWNMSGTPRRPAPGCCRGGWRCLWRRGCTGTCKPSRNLPWKTIHSVGRLNQARDSPQAQVSLVTGHWSVWARQGSPGSGAARLSLRAPSVSRHCARPALPLTAHICANQNWFLPISKYL